MEGSTATPTAPTSTTPAVTTGTSPAAPATSAPSPAITPSQRPSFAQAFATDAATPAPASATPETAATGQAEPTPAAAAPIHPSAEAKGPIPFDVHKTALDNARIKARDEALAEWQPYARVREVKPEVLNDWFGTAQRMSTDPVGFAVDFMAALQADPRYAPQLASHAGRLLAAHRGAEREPQPDVQIVDQAGNVTGTTYSAKQLALRDAWRDRSRKAEVDQQIRPLVEAHERQVAETKQAEQSRVINATADSIVGDVLSILELGPDAANDPLLAEVSTVMAQHPEWTPHKCALEVRNAKLIPTRAQKAEAAALDALKTKAAASISAPSPAALPATKRPTSFLDASLKW